MRAKRDPDSRSIAAGGFDPGRFRRLLTSRRLVESGPVLPVAFVLILLINFAKHAPEELGIDARIYARAADAWLAGGSPWDVYALNWRGEVGHFAALPTSVLAFVPFAGIEERLTVWLWLFASALAAVFIVRRLGLAWWWVLFPPIAHGVFVANPQIVLLALLLSNSSVLAALAPALKIYALAPLVGERKFAAIGVFGLITGASYIVAPGLWNEYLTRAGDIASRLYFEAEGGHSAFAFGPILVACTAAGVIALAFVDLRAAGWLAAPALVPASQFHLASMAAPVVASQGPFFMVLLLAIPMPGLPAVVAGVYGFWRLGSKLRRRDAGPLATPGSGGSP